MPASCFSGGSRGADVPVFSSQLIVLSQPADGPTRPTIFSAGQRVGRATAGACPRGPACGSLAPGRPTEAVRAPMHETRDFRPTSQHARALTRRGGSALFLAGCSGASPCRLRPARAFARPSQSGPSCWTRVSARAGLPGFDRQCPATDFGLPIWTPKWPGEIPGSTRRTSIRGREVLPWLAAFRSRSKSTRTGRTII